MMCDALFSNKATPKRATMPSSLILCLMAKARASRRASSKSLNWSRFACSSTSCSSVGLRIISSQMGKLLPGTSLGNFLEKDICLKCVHLSLNRLC